jgi:nickel-dependent lactate racemase
MKVCLPELIWYGNTTMEIDLPDDWEVEFCPMRGAKRKTLTIDEMEKDMGDPIGSPCIKELARGKKSAVVIFDDIIRPTRVYEIAPLVIGELIAG